MSPDPNLTPEEQEKIRKAAEDLQEGESELEALRRRSSDRREDHLSRLAADVPDHREAYLAVDRARVDEIGQLERMHAEAHGSSVADRIRGVWDVIRGTAEWLVILAEDLFGPGTGQEKKKWVMDELFRVIERMEKRLDLIPGWIQPLVFMIARRLIGPAVEAALAKVKRLGAL